MVSINNKNIEQARVIQVATKNLANRNPIINRNIKRLTTKFKILNR